MTPGGSPWARRETKEEGLERGGYLRKHGQGPTEMMQRFARRIAHFFLRGAVVGKSGARRLRTAFNAKLDLMWFTPGIFVSVEVKSDWYPAKSSTTTRRM